MSLKKRKKSTRTSLLCIRISTPPSEKFFQPVAVAAAEFFRSVRARACTPNRANPPKVSYYFHSNRLNIIFISCGGGGGGGAWVSYLFESGYRNSNNEKKRGLILIEPIRIAGSIYKPTDLHPLFRHCCVGSSKKHPPPPLMQCTAGGSTREEKEEITMQLQLVQAKGVITAGALFS